MQPLNQSTVALCILQSSSGYVVALLLNGDALVHEGSESLTLRAVWEPLRGMSGYHLPTLVMGQSSSGVHCQNIVKDHSLCSEIPSGDQVPNKYLEQMLHGPLLKRFACDTGPK